MLRYRSQGCVDCALVLLEAKAFVDHADDLAMTPLIHASGCGFEVRESSERFGEADPEVSGEILSERHRSTPGSRVSISTDNVIEA